MIMNKVVRVYKVQIPDNINNNGLNKSLKYVKASTCKSCINPKHSGCSMLVKNRACYGYEGTRMIEPIQRILILLLL